MATLLFWPTRIRAQIRQLLTLKETYIFQLSTPIKVKSGSALGSPIRHKKAREASIPRKNVRQSCQVQRTIPCQICSDKLIPQTLPGHLSPSSDLISGRIALFTSTICAPPNYPSRTPAPIRQKVRNGSSNSQRSDKKDSCTVRALPSWDRHLYSIPATHRLTSTLLFAINKSGAAAKTSEAAQDPNIGSNRISMSQPYLTCERISTWWVRPAKSSNSSMTVTKRCSELDQLCSTSQWREIYSQIVILG